MAKVNRLVDWILSVFLGACITALVVIAFGQVIGRYMFGASFSWAEDLCVVLFAWTIWTSACLLIRDGRHLKLTILTSKLSQTNARRLKLIEAVLTLGFLVIVFFAGLGSMEAMVGMEFTALPLPLNAKFSSVPVGTALFAYYILRRLIGDWKEN